MPNAIECLTKALFIQNPGTGAQLWVQGGGTGLDRILVDGFELSLLHS